MIEIDALSLSLSGRTVIDGVSARLMAGRVTAIIGANGAGKTSLVRALAGLLSAASGQVSLDGVPVSGLERLDRARRIGYLPQNGQPAWAITVRELAALGRFPHRNAFAAENMADQVAIEAALRATDTLHLADRPIDQISGGERARAKMARVLAGQPDWILADEPLANLDPPHQRDLLALFRDAARSGKGVVTVLHQLDAATFADDVLILKDGRAVAFGPASDVLTPAHLQTAYGMAFDVFDRNGRLHILPSA
jgi:iron complex transport system ATP-binding protein